MMRLHANQPVHGHARDLAAADGHVRHGRIDQQVDLAAQGLVPQAGREVKRRQVGNRVEPVAAALLDRPPFRAWPFMASRIDMEQAQVGRLGGLCGAGRGEQRCQAHDG